MLKRKYMIIGFLAFCLTVTLFIGATTSGKQNEVSNTTNLVTASPAEYDPWCDIDGNGEIRIKDIVLVALRFGTEGTPINRAAVQFEGNISVPAAAFVPKNNTQKALNTGLELVNFEDTYNVEFWASVQLPHGATVTNFTCYWYDSGAASIDCILYTGDQNGYVYMAWAPSSGASGPGSSYDDLILNYPIVDNNQRTYFLYVRIPPSVDHYGYVFYCAFIEYEYV